MEYIGRFSLGNKVMVSDPCYGTDTWCQGVLENVRKGFWDAYIKVTDEGNWGERVAELVAINLDYNDEYDGLTSEDINELQEFEVGVDSGCAGIFDYEYYCKYHDNKHADEDWYTKEICDQFFPTFDYSGWEKSIFTEFEGVASNSGYGDGGYDCYVARNEEGEIVGIKIVYISDNTDEE
jgi:hypothetical protein